MLRVGFNLQAVKKGKSFLQTVDSVEELVSALIPEFSQEHQLVLDFNTGGNLEDYFCNWLIDYLFYDNEN